MIDFNIDGYIKLLNIIKSQYKVGKFSDLFLEAQSNSVSKKCILRHDIDYCVESALCIAKIEKEHEIDSSFYFLVDSHHYNVVSPESIKIIKEIASMGHEIALHFDCSSYSPTEHHDVIQNHIHILSRASKTKITSVSFHNPGIYKDGIVRDDSYNTLYNTYADNINSRFVYFSDSLCRFRDENFVNKIMSGSVNNLHLLIHPIWWIAEGKMRDEKMMNFLNKNRSNIFNEYKKIIDKYGL